MPGRNRFRGGNQPRKVFDADVGGLPVVCKDLLKLRKIKAKPFLGGLVKGLVRAGRFRLAKG